MKRFLLKIAPFIAFILLLEVAFPMIVDPYNVFHYRQIRDNGVEPNNNFIKMKYILDNPDKYDSFLFGSSRTGFVDVTRIPEGNWYNMSYSEGVPAEHYQNLVDMINHGIIPKNVMIGVDNISAFVDPAIHENEFYRIPYPGDGPFAQLGFYANYLSMRGVIESLEIIRNHEVTDPEYVTRYYENGNSIRNIGVINDWKKNDAPYWDQYYDNDCMTAAIRDLRQIVALCDEYDIHLILFTNPMYIRTYYESKIYGYELFLSWLSDVSEFYNFSSPSEVAYAQKNFLENSHYRMEVGDMIVDRIFYGITDERLEEQGFGLYVKEGEFGELKEILESAPEEPDRKLFHQLNDE